MVRVVRDQQQGTAAIQIAAHVGGAFALEGHVADREDLVDQQDVGVHVRGDRVRETRLHPGAIGLHRRVDEVAELREIDGRVEHTRALHGGRAR